MTYECEICNWYGTHPTVNKELDVVCPVCGNTICTFDEAVDLYTERRHASTLWAV